nr:MAG TPA: hypothetical protein [Caudoviricetes sp.]
MLYFKEYHYGFLFFLTSIELQYIYSFVSFLINIVKAMESYYLREISFLNFFIKIGTVSTAFNQLSIMSSNM